jgi:hypothetical protein
MGKSLAKELKLHRTSDGAAFNAILRHPDVAPYVSLGKEVPDMSKYVEDEQNACYMNQHGGFLCIQGPPTEYTVHTAFTPEGRGPYLRNSALYVAKELFKNGATVLKTFVEDSNAPALRLAIMAGFNKVARSSFEGREGDILFLRKEDQCQPQSL